MELSNKQLELIQNAVELSLHTYNVMLQDEHMMLKLTKRKQTQEQLEENVHLIEQIEGLQKLKLDLQIYLETKINKED